jgi:hypothetical protein
MVKPEQVQLQHTQHGAPLLVAEGPKQHRQGITKKSPMSKVSNLLTDANRMVTVLCRGLVEKEGLYPLNPMLRWLCQC